MTVHASARKRRRCVLQVRAIDAAKRAWGDKDEWKKTLQSLAANGKLEYNEINDTVTIDLPEP